MMRPAASVIVPFAGSDWELADLLAALALLHLRPGDEVIIAHNRRAPGRERRDEILILGAAGVRSPAFARNIGAAAAEGEWLVFLDADARPDPDLLDALLLPPPPPQVGALAGAVLEVATGDGMLARHGLRRGQLDQDRTLVRDRFAYGQSVNLAVARRAFTEVSGFASDARAGEDADLCFRLARAGWGLEVRRQARVEHRVRERLPDRLVQLAVHGAGAAWAERRHPGSFPAPGPGPLARRLGHHIRGGLRAMVHARREEAAFQALDLLETLAFELGRRLPNRARDEPRLVARGRRR